MASLDSAALSTLKGDIYQLIALNPATIRRSAILAAFAPGHDNQAKVIIENLLAALVDDGVVLREGKQGFRAVRPWADVGYAVIGKVPDKRTSAVPVQILNMPVQPDVSVTMSRAEFNKHTLKEGDRIVAALARGVKGQVGLKASLIATANHDKPFHLTGVFNQKAGNFKSLDSSIKTDFKLARALTDKTATQQILVELPSGFDVRNPVVEMVNNQAHDATTGTAITWIVASNHDIAHAHPEDVVREAKCINRTPLDLAGRVDLRHLDLVTVDPAGSSDLDDGFATETGADGYTLYTAIADVPALVLYNTMVDRVAYERGVTYYLSDNHTTHMLPEILSTRKCSLLENQDRLAIVVKQNLGWDCALKSFEVLPAVVRSRSQLTYGQFYDLLDRKDPRFEAIAIIHSTRRQTMNAELKAYLKDQGAFTTKSIVETLMVQTNSLIAQFLKSASVPFLSRNFEQSGQKQGPGQRAYYASYHLGHAELGLLHYAHVTSPIRRYADIINMRAVHKALGNAHIGISDEEISRLDEVAHHLNGRRRVERNIAHDIQKYHAVRDLLRMQTMPVRIGINDIGADYVDISVAQTGVRQRLNIAALQESKCRIDAASHQLVLLDDSGQEIRRYNRGEALLGQLYEVDPERARWKVRLMPHDQPNRTPTTPAAKPS